MKLSLKELELIKRGLNQVTCSADPTYIKICKKIYKKRCRKEIEKIENALKNERKRLEEIERTEYTLDMANKSFKYICDIFNSKNKETLEELSRDIPAITSISKESGSYTNYIVTLNVSLLRKGEGQRIFNFKDEHPHINFKIE